ncbi:MAG: hypothetical protein HY791_38845 [Deltaproteobacteria bacterium]|nr:hypothetical protein [Deltaproteobacteria bacterium]
MRLRLGILVAGIALADPALAENIPSLELELTTSPGAARTCEPRSVLESKVAERLGRNPFSVPAERRVSVRLEALGDTHSARIAVIDLETHEVLGERELTSVDCQELFDAIALSIGLIFDPLGKGSQPPGQPDSPPTSAPDPDPARSVEPTALAAPAGTDPASPSGTQAIDELSVSVGPWLSAGVGPAASVGLRPSISLSMSHLRIGIEAGYDFPTSATVERRSGVAVELISARVLGCFLESPWLGCVVLAAGAHRATGEDLESAEGATTPYSAAGLRLGLVLEVSPRVSLRPELEALLTLTRTTFRVSNEPAWVSPVGSVGFGCAVEFELLEHRRIRDGS